MVYDGHPIQIRESVDGSTLLIQGGRDIATNDFARPCFIVEIEDTHATLLSVEKDTACFTDNWNDSRALVRVAIKLARARGATSFRLTDRSTIRCPDRISLSDLSFLTTGKTWYESILPGLEPADPNKRSQLVAWRHAVTTKTWGELVAGFQQLGVPLVMKGVDPNTRAMDVLSNIKRSGRHCSFFATMMERLITVFGVGSLYEWDWQISLQSRPMGRLTQKRRKRTGAL
jgi:hypothetical protein